MQKKQISYCGTLLRQHDPDRFLIPMLAAAEIREDLWSLFAFNHEISKTRDVVSDTTLGLIRLQWWRDALTDVYQHDKILEHEVLKPLSEAIKRHNLPQEHFDKLIYAREFDLQGVLPANTEGLMNYADFTTEPLLKLAVQICGDNPDVEVIQPIAINYALTGILRATHYNAVQGFYLFPEDLMKEHGVTKSNVFEEQGQENLKNMVKEIISLMLPVTKPDNVVLKACETLSELYKKQITALHYDVMRPEIARDPAFKVLKLFWKTKIL